MLPMTDAVTLLRELAPHVPRDFSLVAFDADDQELAVRSHKGRDLAVPQLSQKMPAIYVPYHLDRREAGPVAPTMMDG
jgi:hypothetical protein